MSEIHLHERENNYLSESFLKDNKEKFNRQCVMVLQLLYRGGRYTAKNVNDILDIADGGRRLRDIFASRKDCKKQIRYTNDKKEGVEYWLDIPQPPTKTELNQWFKEYLEGKYDDKPPTPVIQMDIHKQYYQQNLFE